MTELLRLASRITNSWNLAAYGIAVIAYIVLKRRGKVPIMAWVTVLLLVLIPTSASFYLEFLRQGLEEKSIYRVRVTVIDPRQVPVENAKLWSSIGGEPKRVAGGWQFDIPVGSRPAEGSLTIFASMPAAFLSGQVELLLGNDYNPTVTIRLVAGTSAVVRGIVIDASGKAVAGTRIGVGGYKAETVITDAGGNFVLPAHAANGQQVLLHAEKEGYRPVTQWHPAGDEPVEIILDYE